ncbi:Semaphorin-3F [Labeo rohita]|uniref:Semaphorin-3F n=3 Tax=Labeonini TaxID=2743697 RepID=A0ABQ8MN25_LABRO|nr:Semaphorin-3F [Labeo rohita]
MLVKDAKQCCGCVWNELKSTGTAHHFAFLLNSTDYRILRMDEDHDRMYVGSKDYILSLDLNDINKEPLIIHWPVAPQRRTECVLSGKDINGECGNFIRLIEPWNRTHLYVCGTGAYNPICTYVDRGQRAQGLLQDQMPRAGGRTSRAADPSASPEPYAPQSLPLAQKSSRTCKDYSHTHTPSCSKVEYIFRLEPGKVDSGKGKCPFDPKLNSVSALINGQLYAGVYIDFMGTDSAIFRTLGKHTAMRTDQYNSRWLHDPTFVHAQLIPDSAEKNDDKLYFFFREKASEMGQTPMAQSRIGRICLLLAAGHWASLRLIIEVGCCPQQMGLSSAQSQCLQPSHSQLMQTHRNSPERGTDTDNDDGGHCCLVNKWSTFLKARLICSVTGSDGIETHFDELRDVYIQKTQDTKNPVIYGVFSVSGSVFKGSAVCVYSMADVRMVFNGPFAHKEGPNYQWVAYQGKIPYPRPGTCPGGTFTPNMKSTKDYPDEVINFMRNHPTMFNAVYPVHKRPLVVRTNVDYEFTTITVDQVAAADGNYEVLFLGTDRGTIQKVIVLPRDDLQTEELVLEEVEVFRQQLYVSSVVGVTHLALHRCDVYGEACADCCLARDPYCAWDGKSCSRYSANQKRRSRRQDVKYGNPIRQCRGYNSNANKNTLETVQYGVEGSTAFLECQARSPHVSIKWHFQKENSDRRREIRSDGRVVRTDQGLLLRSLQLSDGGVYQCTSTEKNFKHTLVKLKLVVLSAHTVNTIQTETPAPATPPLQSSAWTPSAEQYKDLLTILSQPEMGLINQYCQDYWQMGDDPATHAHKKKDLKEVQKDLRKPRNRRHHQEQSSMAET